MIKQTADVTISMSKFTELWQKVTAELLQLQRLFRADVLSILLLSKELQAVKSFSVINKQNR